MEIIKEIRSQAKKLNKKIVLPEGSEERVIQASAILSQEKIATPILIGDEKVIMEKLSNIDIQLDEIKIINPLVFKHFDEFAEIYHQIRKHKGLSQENARKFMQNPLFFSAMLVRENYADGAVAGSINTTGDVLRAAIHIIGLRENIKVVSSSMLMVLKDGKILTFADCAVIPDPDPEQLASIAISTAQTHKKLIGTEPCVAMLSFSTKGSAKHPLTEKIIDSINIIKKKAPDLKVDGELQFDAAYISNVGERKAPGSEVAGKANVFIFPDLNAGNIAYKVAERLAGAAAIGPIIQGLGKPYNDLSRGCSVDDIINVAAICSILS
jgi:phosphate acetyltransferase